MRGVVPLGRLASFAVCGGVLFAVAAPASAAAQSRKAAIRVSATVRGITDVDMIGAHAVAGPSLTSRVGAASEAGGWRITGGRGSTLGIQVDGAGGAAGEAAAPRVTICDGSGAPADTCQPYRAPLLERSAGRAGAEFVVRVGRPASAQRRAVTPVRLTVALLD
jgi:hypothetical protein